MSALDELDLTQLIQRLEQLNQQNQQLQNQIQTLKSNNAKLNNENQQLNDKIVTMNEADQIMQQNRALSAQIKVTAAQAQGAKQEAQQQLTQAQTMRTQVQAKAAQLDTVIQRQVAAETRHTKREVTERYQKKTLKTQALLFLPTVYAVVLTVIELFKVPSLWSDSQQFLRQLGWLITQPAGWITQGLRPAWLRELTGGLLGLVMMGMLLGVLGVIAYSASQVNWHFIDTVMLLGILIGIILFGETIKALWPVNLMWLLVLSMASYVGIRSIMTK